MNERTYLILFSFSLLGLSGLSPASVSADTSDDAARDESSAEVRWSELHAFDRDYAIGVYGLGWTGPYNGGGGGARVRWEPFEKLGVDVYTEHLVLQDSDGLRHDHPVGFNLYVPFRVHQDVRIRPLFGFCSVFSFLHPDQSGADRVDDVHFGVHAGAGVEYALGRFVSLFFDAQVTSYFGHNRYSGGWSTHVSDQIDLWVVFSGALGVQVHL